MCLQVDVSLFVRTPKNLSNYFENVADSADGNARFSTMKRLQRAGGAPRLRNFSI